jgi:5-methylthioadenosine/S-adenosylhomocysteine deaminase
LGAPPPPRPPPAGTRHPARSGLALPPRVGAAAAGLADRVGTLEAGKQADVILVRTDAIHMTPAIEAVGAVVLNANVSDVDTVFVGGRCVKKDGKLVGVDWPALSERLCASSRRIVDGMRSLDRPGIEEMAAQLIPRLD